MPTTCVLHHVVVCWVTAHRASTGLPAHGPARPTFHWAARFWNKRRVRVDQVICLILPQLFTPPRPPPLSFLSRYIVIPPLFSPQIWHTHRSGTLEDLYRRVRHPSFQFGRSWESILQETSIEVPLCQVRARGMMPSGNPCSLSPSQIHYLLLHHMMIWDLGLDLFAIGGHTLHLMTSILCSKFFYKFLSIIVEFIETLESSVSLLWQLVGSWWPLARCTVRRMLVVRCQCRCTRPPGA
jgi:hypothetical protein